MKREQSRTPSILPHSSRTSESQNADAPVAREPSPKHTVEVHPLRCRMWSLHPRLEEHLTEESCRAEIESFEKHGQLLPVLGRRLRGDRDYDIELIYGARRLFVARHLGLQLQVELQEMSDQEAIVAMDLENRLRQDLSPYERAIGYERWLREGHFASQDEIANALQISSAQLSRLLKLARLPRQVVDAFPSVRDLCAGWGVELSALLKEDLASRGVLQAAEGIAALPERPPAEEVFRLLCAAAKSSKAGKDDARVVTDRHGNELFRVRHQRGAVVINVLMELLSKSSLEQIERVLASMLSSDLTVGAPAHEKEMQRPAAVAPVVPSSRRDVQRPAWV